MEVCFKLIHWTAFRQIVTSTFFVFLVLVASTLNAACIGLVGDFERGSYFDSDAGSTLAGEWGPISIRAEKASFLIIENDDENSAIGLQVVVSKTGILNSRCRSDLVTLHANETAIFRLPALGKSNIFIVTAATGNLIKYNLFSDIHPDFQTSENGIIVRPLDVFLFENHPEFSKIHSHVEVAIARWRRAGIHFKPKFHYFRGDRIKSILGEDEMLRINPNHLMYAPGEDQEVNSLIQLKENPKNISAVFAKVTIDGNQSTGFYLGTRSDPIRMHTYIAEACSAAGYPLTIAHEIGHLLLGSGHNNHSSGLMRACSQGISSHLSSGDIEKARLRAQMLPK